MAKCVVNGCGESIEDVVHHAKNNPNYHQFHSGNYWNDNGDMVVVTKTIFRRMGWLIGGGPNDGKVVEEITPEHTSVPVGSFTPLYMELGD